MRNQCILFNEETKEFSTAKYPVEQEIVKDIDIAKTIIVAKNITKAMAEEFIMLMKLNHEKYLTVKRVGLDWQEFYENCL
jgi:hypothetical protein